VNCHNGRYVNAMAEILKVVANWSGFVGAPGYTNFYFRDFSAGAPDQAMADGAVAKADAFFDAWVTYLPNTVTILVSPTVEVIEETTGTLTGFFTTSPDTTRAGTVAGTYSAASGAVCNWYTNGIRNGRRIKGRTFMVPLAGNAFDAAGSIDNTKLGAMRLAATNFISATGAGDLGVWARPTSPGASDGIWYAASAATVPDMAAVLRSRRD